MPSRENIEPVRHPAPMIALHWLTLAALLAGVALVLVREAFDGRAVRYGLLEAHRYAGLLVLALLSVRLAVRMVLAPLPLLAQAAPLARAAAALVHILLYLLLAAVPMLGWLMSSAHGQNVHFLGVPLPALTEPDDDFADIVQQWHAIAAWTLLALGAVHGLAALWHHFVRRDAVLAAMLPRLPGKSYNKPQQEA
jgi:cytochrome b561